MLTHSRWSTNMWKIINSSWVLYPLLSFECLGCLRHCLAQNRFSFLFFFLKNICVCVWLCVSLCTPQVCRRQTRVLDSPGVRVASSCEPPDMGVRNHTQILCKGSKCLSRPSASRPGQNDFLLRCGGWDRGQHAGRVLYRRAPHRTPLLTAYSRGASDRTSMVMSGSGCWFQSWFSAKRGVSECPSTWHRQFPPPKMWANKKRNWYLKEENQTPTPGRRSSWPHRRNGSFKEL